MLESYIVRIFRRNKDKAETVAGIVERVDDEKREAFRTPAELLRILRLSRSITIDCDDER